MEKLVFQQWLAGTGMVKRCISRMSRQEGQTAVEYGLIIGFVALMVVAAFVLLGGRVRDAINAVANAINVSPQ